MNARSEKEVGLVVLTGLFATMILLGGGLAAVGGDHTALPPATALSVGPIRFVEIYFLTGDQMERRSPRVGEEFTVKANIRNEGSTVIYYLPTLCDTSLSAIFDPHYVRVESGRPRCLAASMPTPLKPGEETTVWAPESGTAYVAIRAGSTTTTVVFSYNTDSRMDQSTQSEARSTVPLTIQDGLGNFPIQGFPTESLILGFALAIGLLVYVKRSEQDRTRVRRRFSAPCFKDSVSLEPILVLGTVPRP